MSSASYLVPVLVTASVFAFAALAAMSWALAPFVRAIYQGGTTSQKGVAGGLILLAVAEAAYFAWMAVTL